MFFKTSDIARKANIHPNTVRFYEQIGYISPVLRAKNGYRLFNYRHLYQVMVLRCIFFDDWPGKRLREASLKIIDSLKLWELKAARTYTEDYIRLIKLEYEKAEEAAQILKKWANSICIPQLGKTYNRIEAAELIGNTPETLRNWERNGLIDVPRIGENKKRIYGQQEIERLKVIYMLRQSRYSMSAIHRCLKKFDAHCNEEALVALHNPETEDVVWTGDHWLCVLEKTYRKAKEILEILDKIEK